MLWLMFLTEIVMVGLLVLLFSFTVIALMLATGTTSPVDKVGPRTQRALPTSFEPDRTLQKASRTTITSPVANDTVVFESIRRVWTRRGTPGSERKRLRTRRTGTAKRTQTASAPATLSTHLQS